MTNALGEVAYRQNPVCSDRIHAVLAPMNRVTTNITWHLSGPQAVVSSGPKFDSNLPPTCEPNSGQSLSPMANDHSSVVKIADLGQKIAKR